MELLRGLNDFIGSFFGLVANATLTIIPINPDYLAFICLLATFFGIFDIIAGPHMGRGVAPGWKQRVYDWHKVFPNEIDLLVILFFLPLAVKFFLI